MVYKKTEQKVKKNSVDTSVETSLETFELCYEQYFKLLNEMKLLGKMFEKTKKMAEKESKKNKKTINKNTRRIGFAKPCKLSNELCDFLNIRHGSELPRPQVTKKIHEYISENKLHDKETKRSFTPDEKLKKLFGDELFFLKNSEPDLGKGYSYFNMQKYLKQHFI